MAFRSSLSGFPTKPLCYMNVAGTDGKPSLDNARKPNNIGVYGVTGSKWTDVSKTRLKAAQNVWVYEVLLLGGVETRFALTDAVAARQVFKKVSITFHSRTIIDDDHTSRVVIEPGTDTFTDVVFFWKDKPKPGRPFERFYFAGTAESDHRPRI